MKRKVVMFAFEQAMPIVCSYLFVSMAYGMMMQEAGFAWFWSLLISFTVYTGAFQFVLVTLLSSGASILTIAVTAFFMNSRQIFYGLSFVDEFKKMGNKCLYMIHTMTDETYAVNCSMMQKAEADIGDELLQNDSTRSDSMFYVAVFSRWSWMIGAVLGGILGQLIPFQMEGIDFCMTALFIVIFIDQWEASKNHLPAAFGIVAGIFCLFVFGQDNFMLPALILASGLLLVFEKKGEMVDEF